MIVLADTSGWNKAGGTRWKVDDEAKMTHWCSFSPAGNTFPLGLMVVRVLGVG